MPPKELLLDYALLPCILAASAISWYQGDESTAMGCLIMWAVAFYFSRLFTPVSWATRRQQQQLDTQQHTLMAFADKVNELLERLNETLKRTNDNHSHLKLCDEAIHKIKEDLFLHTRSLRSVEYHMRGDENSKRLD